MPCLVIHAPYEPEPILSAEFESRGHVSGPDEAPVTIVVFAGYQCPGCSLLAASLKQVRLAHPDDLRLVHLHAPQPDLDKDAAAVQAVEAANLQGMFWEMHDLLYEKQDDWIDLPPGQFEAWAAGQAAGLGMDAVRFRADFQGPVVAERLRDAVQFSADTPSLVPPLLFVNSSLPYTGLADFASLDEVVRQYALAGRQFSACPPWVVDPARLYLATLQTSRGEVVIQLYPDKAPLAVNNFVYLARSGWFDGITFHRVIPGFVAQTGDPSGTGKGNPGYYFETEPATGLHFDRAGMVGMANSGAGTNGSQFFITYAPAPHLDGSFTVFGKVLRGMDVLAALQPRDPQPGLYLPPGDELIRVTIEER